MQLLISHPLFLSEAIHLINSKMLPFMLIHISFLSASLSHFYETEKSYVSIVQRRVRIPTRIYILDLRDCDKINVMLLLIPG